MFYLTSFGRSIPLSWWQHSTFFFSVDRKLEIKSSHENVHLTCGISAEWGRPGLYTVGTGYTNINNFVKIKMIQFNLILPLNITILAQTELI